MVLSPPNDPVRTAGSRITGVTYKQDVTDAVNFLANPPIFRGLQTVAQALTSGALTPVTFDTSTYDTYSGHSNVTNNSRYVAQEAGYYTIAGTGAFSSNASGSRQSVLAVNGVSQAGTTGFVGTNPSGILAVDSAVLDIFLNSNDYIELWVAQDSGSTINTSVASGIQCSLWIRFSHA